MIVLLDGSPEATASDVVRTVEFIPGAVEKHAQYLKAYTAMAQRAGFTLAEALEKRYEYLVEEVRKPGIDDSEKKSHEAEIEMVGSPAGEKGSEDRAKWFRDFAASIGESRGGDPSDELAGLLTRNTWGNKAPDTPLRQVRTPALDAMKEAVENHAALNWDARMENLAATVGEVLQVDHDDGTTKVKFTKAGIAAWLPTAVLEDVPPP